MTATAAAAAALPTGTVTFLFTDIEGSTRLWEMHPEPMRAALARHDALLRQAFQGKGGTVFKSTGDGCAASFSTASGALDAALDAQRSLIDESWPEPVRIRVRMALHTGAAELREGDYFGPPLNRVARLLASAHGGQVLLSGVTQELTRDHLPEDVFLRDLGWYRLRDLDRPEHVFQLEHPRLPARFPPLRTLDNLPNNLPLQITSFVGREREVADVKRLLGAVRLLTLTGSGGCGKSRLSVQLGADLLTEYPDGVWLVEMAALSDPSLLDHTLASVLNVSEEVGRPLLQTITENLRGKTLLLLLDNAEHLLSACANAAETLLRACPRLRILVTSREALAISGETTYRVPSLALPDPSEQFTPQQLSQYEAVRLFIDRAISVQPGFAVNNQNAPAVAQVCHRLDGIPLAIELAAARVRAMPVEQIAGRLDDRFRLLTGGSRTALPRQQTLRALIDWSYNLLSPQERTLLNRLSVFLGGWTLEAAEAVCAGGEIEDWQVLDLLTSLVDKSLVVYEDQSGAAARYRLLETIRQYARDALAAAGKEALTRTKHTEHFLEIAETAATYMQGPREREWLQRLAVEFDNIRAALEWACSLPGQGACRLVCSLYRYWHSRAWAEGESWCLRALSTEGGKERSACRAKTLALLGGLAGIHLDAATAVPSLCEALEIAREMGDEDTAARALNSLSNESFRAGDLDQALAQLQEAVSIYERQGNDRGKASCLVGLGNVVYERGDREEAQRLYHTALESARSSQDYGLAAVCLGNLADMCFAEEDYPKAKAYKKEALAACREILWEMGAAGCLMTLSEIARIEGDRAESRAGQTEAMRVLLREGITPAVVHCLFCLARMAADDGDHYRAAVMFGATLRLGREWDKTETVENDAAFKQTGDILGPEAMVAAMEYGGSMTIEEAVAYAARDEDDSGLSPLLWSPD